MINLSVQDVLELQVATGFIFPDGIGSALSSYRYYDDLKMQIISVFYGLVKNHCFSDGNKRTAVLVLFYLAQKNNLPILPDDAALEKIVLTAASSPISKEQLARQIFG